MSKTESTYWIEICIAGDLSIGKQVCRKYCYEVGLCVTVVPADFIYTGGEESGMIIRLVNYPRFPNDQYKIKEIAVDLGCKLRKELCQHTFLLVDPSVTEWFDEREKCNVAV